MNDLRSKASTEAREAGASPLDRAWLRPGLFVLGGLVGLGVAAVLGSSIASASPHAAGPAVASSSAPSSGVTLCATSAGAVHHVAKRGCPHADTTLSLGNESQVKTLTSKVTVLTADVQKLTTENSTLKADANTDASSISSLRAKVEALEELTTGMTRTVDPDSPAGKPWPLLTIAGENVEINNGVKYGETESDGLGNLIVGFTSDNPNDVDRSGSNNLIVGSDNGWSGFGGLVAGSDNDITSGGYFASVTGGYGNVATNNSETISGGYYGQASGIGATISGGYSNDVAGNFSSILGGYGQTVPLSAAPCTAIPSGVATAGC